MISLSYLKIVSLIWSFFTTHKQCWSSFAAALLLSLNPASQPQTVVEPRSSGLWLSYRYVRPLGLLTFIPVCDVSAEGNLRTEASEALHQRDKNSPEPEAGQRVRRRSQRSLLAGKSQPATSVPTDCQVVVQRNGTCGSVTRCSERFERVAHAWALLGDNWTQSLLDI